MATLVLDLLDDIWPLIFHFFPLPASLVSTETASDWDRLVGSRLALLSTFLIRRSNVLAKRSIFLVPFLLSGSWETKCCFHGQWVKAGSNKVIRFVARDRGTCSFSWKYAALKRELQRSFYSLTFARKLSVCTYWRISRNEMQSNWSFRTFLVSCFRLCRCLLMSFL